MSIETAIKLSEKAMRSAAKKMKSLAKKKVYPKGILFVLEENCLTGTASCSGSEFLEFLDRFEEVLPELKKCLHSELSKNEQPSKEAL